jgi:RNA polymerase sigma-70 factor (ECF subfamily)
MTVATSLVREHRRTFAAPTFADVAAAHMPAVHRYLTQMVRDSHLAEDLTAETFERAFVNWHQFNPAKGSALTWLITIGRRIALDHLRSDARRRGRETRVAAQMPTSTAPPEVNAMSPDLAAALDHLSQVEREVVALRVLLDVDGASAAALMGITPSACSTHLHRAMTKLRKELNQD